MRTPITMLARNWKISDSTLRQMNQGREGEIVLSREKHTDWLSNTKWLPLIIDKYK